MERSLVRSIYRFRQLRTRFNVLRSALDLEERGELEELERRLRRPNGARGDVTDRREFHRFDVAPATAVELEVGKTWTRTELRNLGGGGFAVRAVPGVERGAFVRLRLMTDALTRYEFPAQVVSSDGGVFGCAFVGMPERRHASATPKAGVKFFAAGTQPMHRISPDEVEDTRRRNAQLTQERQRAQCAVMVTCSEWGAILAYAGFSVVPVESASAARELFRRSEAPVAGVVVAHDEVEAYAAEVGHAASVFGVSGSAAAAPGGLGLEIERVLGDLDGSVRALFRLRTLLGRRAEQASRQPADPAAAPRPLARRP